MSGGQPSQHIKKRIIVCCDGTWMNSDSSSQVPSNVTRIARCLRQEGFDRQTGLPIPQLIYYNAGVGTEDSSFITHYFGGGTGAGLAGHIRDAYSFVCNNYCDGDEIFIIGFSRGAFTARSIASLIHEVGLLTQEKGLHYFVQIFDDWEYQNKIGWKSKYPNDPWTPRIFSDRAAYAQKLLEMGLTRPNIPIKAVAVWDTVGALGIPMVSLFPQPESKDFSFVDTKVPDNIEYAFHALGLDEARRAYAPTIWEKPAGQQLPRVLKQTWFAGVHADIGGSYPETDLANITLSWMISQLDPLLDFDHNWVIEQFQAANQYYIAEGQQPRDWGLGEIHDSLTGMFKVGGSRTRTPKEYRQTDSTKLGSFVMDTVKYWLRMKTDNQGPLLEHTNETVHSSVRIRMGLGGRGYGDKPGSTYDSEALTGWTMTAQEVPQSQSGSVSNVVWKKSIADGLLEMPEEPLTDFERVVIKMWPNLAANFNSIRPGDHPQDVQQGGSGWGGPPQAQMSGGGPVKMSASGPSSGVNNPQQPQMQMSGPGQMNAPANGGGYPPPPMSSAPNSGGYPPPPTNGAGQVNGVGSRGTGRQDSYTSATATDEVGGVGGGYTGAGKQQQQQGKWQGSVQMQ